MSLGGGGWENKQRENASCIERGCIQLPGAMVLYMVVALRHGLPGVSHGPQARTRPAKPFPPHTPGRDSMRLAQLAIGRFNPT